MYETKTAQERMHPKDTLVMKCPWKCPYR